VANSAPSGKMLQKSEKDLKWIAGMCEKVVDIRRVQAPNIGGVVWASIDAGTTLSKIPDQEVCVEKCGK